MFGFLPVLHPHTAPCAPKNPSTEFDADFERFSAIFARFLLIFAPRFFGNFVDKFIKIQKPMYKYAFQVWLLADRSGERIFRRDDAPSAVPQGSPPPAEEKSEATLRSVSTADLQLPTERKFCYIDSALGIQTWLLVDRSGVRRFRRDCCPGSSPSEPPCPAQERGDDVSSPLSLESLPTSRHWRTSGRHVARA